jgi:hypothetical protein
MSRSDDLADIESGLLAMRGMNNAVITAAKALTDSETGFLLVDATAAGFTLTLPPATRSMDIRVQRVDNSGNRLVVQAAGAEKVLFHTHLRPEGYPFFVLMGAGDFWHLRSDGNGNWRVIDRMDATPLGRPVFETTMAFSPGGWVAHTGLLYVRSEWPWVWDHAQQSGLLTTEAARAGKEGCWTSGDGATTFRAPEGRGVFIRILDEARGLDASRTAGSYQSDGVGDIKMALLAVNNGGPQTTTSLGGSVLNGTLTATGAAAGTMVNSYLLSQVITPASDTRPKNIAYPGRLKLI